MTGSPPELSNDPDEVYEQILRIFRLRFDLPPKKRKNESESNYEQHDK